MNRGKRPAYRIRRRSGLRRKFRPASRGGRGRLCLLLALLLSVCAALFAEFRLAPVVIESAAAKLNGRLTVLANEAVMQVLSSRDIAYSDLIETERSDGGRVTALQTDMPEINRLKSEIVLALQSRLNEVDGMEFYIPAGVLTGSQILSGYGFRIPARVLSAEFLASEWKDDFQSAGINQTRHKLWLEVTASGVVGVGAHRREVTVTTQVPVAETVIVGTVPDFYSGSGGWGTAVSKNPEE